MMAPGRRHRVVIHLALLAGGVVPDLMGLNADEAPASGPGPGCSPTARPPANPGTKVIISIRIGLHPLNELDPDKARSGSVSSRNFLYRRNHIGVLPLDHIHIVAGHGQDLPG